MALRVKVTEAMRVQLTALLSLDPSTSSISTSVSTSSPITASETEREKSSQLSKVTDDQSSVPEPDNVSLSEDEKKKIVSELESGYLSVGTVRLLSTKCAIQCTSFLKGSQVTSSQAIEAAKESSSATANSALLKRRQYLQMKQQEREYNRMTFGTDTYVFDRIHQLFILLLTLS